MGNALGGNYTIELSDFPILRQLFHFFLDDVSITARMAVRMYEREEPRANMHLAEGITTREQQLILSLAEQFPPAILNNWIRGQFNMYYKQKHNDMATILEKMDNKDVLVEHKVFFAGGTSIALLHNEVRESVDLDFMANEKGYSTIRRLVWEHGLEYFFPDVYKEARIDRYGIRGKTRNGIKIEIIANANISLSGSICRFGFPALDLRCLFAEKILANSERYMDTADLYKDIIDIGILHMTHNDTTALLDGMETAINAYGHCVKTGIREALKLLKGDAKSVKEFFQIDNDTMDRILKSIETIPVQRAPAKAKFRL
jgi:hypothetical protein